MKGKNVKIESRELKQSRKKRENNGLERNQGAKQVPSHPVREHQEPIHIYLREIGQVPLLSVEEENKLAVRIQQGDKQAREEMIKANLRLVVKIAHDYEGLGVPLLDLINEGNIGLMKAVDRFDPNKGAKLSTYASWWIKQSIKRALANQAKTIRLPVHVTDKLSKIRRMSMELEEEFDREPTDDELGEALGMSASRIGELRSASIQPASLDAPIHGEETGTFSELIEDDRAEMPFDQLNNRAVLERLPKFLEKLSSREAEILRYRFGLSDGEEKTLEIVGEKFGVTRERVRQLQNSALRKLRKQFEQEEEITPVETDGN